MQEGNTYRVASGREKLEIEGSRREYISVTPLYSPKDASSRRPIIAQLSSQPERAQLADAGRPEEEKKKEQFVSPNSVSNKLERLRKSSKERAASKDKRGRSLEKKKKRRRGKRSPFES